MTITMVKKRLANGEACRKCVQAEELLRKRGQYGRIDRVVWAVDGDEGSEGMRLAREHGVGVAPFFVVEDGGHLRVITSVLELAKSLAPAASAGAVHGAGQETSWLRSAEDHPEHDAEGLVRMALERFGKGCALAFSGAEDVVLVDMAARANLPFSVLLLETGRLHPDTYRFIDEVRRRYELELDVLFPDPADVEPLVRGKGFFSFYQDGHAECCAVRKVKPLQRGLRRYRAWMTGQRRDQSPTRASVPAIEVDPRNEGAAGPLVKLNPLAAWSSHEVWGYIRDRGLPVNELFHRGYRSIGCEPCTRPVVPGEHERAGRWWWEENTRRECGLHVTNPGRGREPGTGDGTSDA